MTINYRDYVLQLVEEGHDINRLLSSCLRYMTQEQVKEMLETNDYPDPLTRCDEDCRSYGYIPYRY